MTTNFDKVGVFHLMCDHPVKTSPQYDIFISDFNLMSRRSKFILSEIDEFISAYSSNDRVEMIDAICDSLYFCYGTQHVFGIQYNDIDIDYESKNDYNIDDYIKSLKTCIDDYNCIISPDCSEENEIKWNRVKICINSIISLLFQLGVFLNFSFDIINKCFDAVHTANLSKFCKTEDEAICSVEFYKSHPPHDYPDGCSPNYFLKNDLFVIYSDVDKKTLKSINFKKPNESIKSIINL